MKVLCILYDDPKEGMPKSYPLSDLPKLEKYPDGMTLPSPKGRDFTPGQLLGCVSGELGLRKFLESNGHELVVTNSKDGDGCEADKHIVDADIVISQPFFPYYLTKERIAKAKNLKMAITAGIGSDHVDLQAAMDNKIDVVEVTFCNSRSVAEHIVMMIVSMVRDYHNQHRIVNDGGWNIADAVQRSYDVEGMHIGTVAAGRIGLDALRKMKPFDVHLHYFDRHRLPEGVEKEDALYQELEAFATKTNMSADAFGEACTSNSEIEMLDAWIEVSQLSLNMLDGFEKTCIFCYSKDPKFLHQQYKIFCLSDS